MIPLWVRREAARKPLVGFLLPQIGFGYDGDVLHIRLCGIGKHVVNRIAPRRRPRERERRMQSPFFVLRIVRRNRVTWIVCDRRKIKAKWKIGAALTRHKAREKMAVLANRFHRRTEQRKAAASKAAP